MADRFIAVAGNMGVGKTTLVAWLTARYGIQPVFEPFADNPYLDDFYRDMRAWGFHSQVWFLSHKYRLHRELERTAGVLVQDRTIYEDAEIFAAHLHRSKKMSQRDWETYSEMYRAMRSSPWRSFSSAAANDMRTCPSAPKALPATQATCSRSRSASHQAALVAMPRSRERARAARMSRNA